MDNAANGELPSHHDGSPSNDIQSAGKLPTSVLLKEQPPLLTRLKLYTQVSLLQSVVTSFFWWKKTFSTSLIKPDLVKAYDTRPHLPVRIFLPPQFDPASGATLPLLFTIHGSAFCVGEARNDDEWNRAFANATGIMVAALNYSKAPQHPFPCALYDLEAVILEVLADQTLPIRRVSRENTTAAPQRVQLRDHENGPAAAVSVYGVLDFSRPNRTKALNRHYKNIDGPRGVPTDPLLSIADIIDWNYVPFGHDTRDRLVSPFYANLDDLPPFVGFISAELDMYGFDGWSMACRLREDARKETASPETNAAANVAKLPDPDSDDPLLRVMGRPKASDSSRPLDGTWDWKTRTGERDERFGWEEDWTTTKGQNRGLKWLLVPDVAHGFDTYIFRESWGHQETIKDAEWKQGAYIAELGGWLNRTVWALDSSEVLS
ncbi:hypothetical protein PT974_04772 [Cladobotryum mycophilum]|uniref:Alpha/beta hydrolase fold-3 domain-containing protein n=1 Tax=Cladobotryum mycophilum TaxID=491253 RepID=A0ABR0SQ39_9HYPO